MAFKVSNRIRIHSKMKVVIFCYLEAVIFKSCVFLYLMICIEEALRNH